MARDSLRSVLWAVGFAWAGALFTAALLGACLARVSVDQPLIVQDVAHWGLRWGGVLAVAMASGAALGSPPPATLRSIVSVLASTLLVVIGLALGGALLAAGAVRLHLIGQNWDLPSRTGHGATLAALATAEWVGLPGAVAAGWRLSRTRTSRRRGQGHG